MRAPLAWALALLAAAPLQAGTPAELQALLASEIRRWGDVIRAAKIEPE